MIMRQKLGNRVRKATPSALILGIMVMSIISLGAAADICVPDWFYPTSAGNTGDIRIEDVNASAKNIIYTPSSSGALDWAGIYWLYPAENLGSNYGLDLSGARYLNFSARGEPRATAEFILGGVVGTYSDSIRPVYKYVQEDGQVSQNLTGKWCNFYIDLKDKDLSSVIRGFGVIVSRDQNPDGCTIYLNDICYSN